MSGLFQIDEDFNAVEQKVVKFILKHQKLQKDYDYLLSEIKQIKSQNEKLMINNQELLEENKKIKLVSVLSGNEDHTKLMKNHINRLVKEIDSCIMQIQNVEL